MTNFEPFYEATWLREITGEAARVVRQDAWHPASLEAWPTMDCPCGCSFKGLLLYTICMPPGWDAERVIQFACPKCGRAGSRCPSNQVMLADQWDSKVVEWQKKCEEENNAKEKTMQVGNLKAALAAAMEWVEKREGKRDDPKGAYSLEIGDRNIHLRKSTGQGFSTAYMPPRVAPPKGTPVLVWRTGESKTSAVVAMSEGEIVVMEGVECLLTQIGMSKGIAYGHWSVLVEKGEQ